METVLLHVYVFELQPPLFFFFLSARFSQIQSHLEQASSVVPLLTKKAELLGQRQLLRFALSCGATTGLLVRVWYVRHGHVRKVRAMRGGLR